MPQDTELGLSIHPPISSSICLYSDSIMPEAPTVATKLHENLKFVMMMRRGLPVPVTCKKRDQAASHVLGDQPEVAVDKATRWVRLRGLVETLNLQTLVH